MLSRLSKTRKVLLILLIALMPIGLIKTDYYFMSPGPPYQWEIEILDQKTYDFDGNLYNISSIDGSINWKRKLGSSSQSIYSNSRPIVVDNKIFNPSTGGIFHVLDLKSGNLIFSEVLGKGISKKEIFFLGY